MINTQSYLPVPFIAAILCSYLYLTTDHALFCHQLITYICTNIQTYIQQTSKCFLPPFSPIHNCHQLPLLTRDHIAVVSYIRILHSRQPICAHGSKIPVGTPAVPLQHKGGSEDTSTHQISTEGFQHLCERWILGGSREEKHLNCIYGSVGV